MQNPLRKYYIPERCSSYMGGDYDQHTHQGGVSPDPLAHESPVCLNQQASRARR